MGAALPAVAGGTQVAGSVVGGLATIREGEYSSEVLRDNARVADRVARQALWRGRVEGQRYGRELGKFKGTQRAAIASSGFDPGFGSSLDILTETATIGVTDEQLIRYNAEIEAWRSRVAATDLRNQARLTRWGGRVRGVSQMLGGAGAGLGTILGSGGSGGSGGATTPAFYP